MTTKEILAVEFESIKNDLIQKYNELGMRASGDWANELESRISGNEEKQTAQIIGMRYTEQLVFGRKPGKFPPIKMIEKWIIDKGISLEKNITVSSLAFLIARKIAKEGTKYFQHGGTDLIESVITPERIQSIIYQVSEINVTAIQKGLIEQLKQVA